MPASENPELLETASQHLVPRVPTGRSSETAATAIARLPGGQFDYAGTLYVIDDEGRLAGIVPMANLLGARSDATLAEIALRDAPSVTADTDQEHVASLAIHHGVAAMPVVDGARRLIGVVPPATLLEVLRHEHIEDLHRLAGILHETTRARNAIEAPPLRRARDRLPWLLLGLAGSMLATFVVAAFETALAERVAIAFFIPGIVYLADAIGTQTEAVAVRGLSLSSAPIGRLVGGELRTGMLIGLVLSVCAFVPVWAVFGDLRLAAAVSSALFAASAVATTIGLVLPWLLARLNTDPAFGSGPVATIVQDVLSLVIYFVIVSLIVL